MEDVSFGKNDNIYNAHTYHTKVPHKAIMRYIEHYTKKGDIIFDGFSGSGMTGVASHHLDRKVILSDLSPIAAFIAQNYLTLDELSVDFWNESIEMINSVKEELEWMYHTTHEVNEKNKSIQLRVGEEYENLYGKINYVVWSEVLECPICDYEFPYWQVDSIKNEKREFGCPNCDATLNRKICKNVEDNYFDNLINKEIVQNKYIPTHIVYTYNGKRFQKEPTEFDLSLISKIENYIPPFWIPTTQLMFKNGRWGDLWVPAYHKGVTHSHHFYTKRNLMIYAALWSKCNSQKQKWALTAILNYINKKQSYSGGGGGMPGVLYISSLFQEKNIFEVLIRKVKKLSKIQVKYKANEFIISNQSATDLRNIPSKSLDYIFTDPPFGRNIMYSEASFLWEAWLKVFANNQQEAIVSRTQGKKLPEYTQLMGKAFKEFYRILKPKRWITVEFNNAKSSIWNSIQENISKAGFVIANVSVLDKKTGSFKQVTAPGSVKSDLVISAYKPSQQFESQFLSQAGENMEIDFVKEFLNNLPKNSVIERTEKMLYSKMLAFYIQHGYEIHYNANSFYKMLGNYFVEEDGYWFNQNQLAAYRGWKQKMKLEGMDEVQSGQRLLFVSDEKSALVWLYNFIAVPKSLNEIHAAFRKIANITDDNLPELTELLAENFVMEDGKHRRPTSEEEKLEINEKRERQLMREFEELLHEAQHSKKKIKEVRKEALSFGFETCYKTKRFADILAVAKKLDKRILENNAELNDFVEIAEIKVEGF